MQHLKGKIVLGGNMIISKAIALRISNLCTQKNLSINKLALMSGLTQSTLQSIMDGKSRNPKVLTLVRVCESLDLELKDFFEDPVFENLDSEL